MSTVIDTSTLISLVKITYLELIPKLRKTVLIPEEVYEEAVVRGEEKGLADATVIKQFITSSEVKISSVQGDFIQELKGKINKTLTQGDEAVIALAMQEKAKEIISDGEGLAKIAMALGFRISASPDLLLEGLKDRLMSFQDFETFIRGLVVENRLSSIVAELYLMEGKKNVKD
jgi:predicted nucleic acid-binding protein